ncbi:MAG: DUF167 domain-containing protein [Chloroflexota bacterium]
MHDGHRGAAIAVKVSAGTNRNEITEVITDGTIKIKLAGKTTNAENLNSKLIQFLAEVFDVETAKLDIISGLSGNEKLITILGLDAVEVQQKISSYNK